MSVAIKRPHLVYLATDSVTAFRFMDGQLAYMKHRGFDVSVITAPGVLLERVAEREQVPVYPVAMSRRISPKGDVLALARLTWLLRRLSPDLVNAGTPKAGLLGVLAARMAGVPVVVYLLRGLRFEGTKGAARLASVVSEHVCGALSHRVFCNSPSLQARFVALRCASEAKTFVPAHGTSNGVDVERFAITESARAWAANERRRLNIPVDAFVVGFVGRLSRDKGISELLRAFAMLARVRPSARLLLVGDHDKTDPLPPEARKALETLPTATVTGFVPEPGPFYALMDVLAFPSFREGFPNVPLEAAAAGVPCVAFRATGTVDAVVHESTGVLVRLGDAEAFGDALVRYALNDDLRAEHGRNAQARVKTQFRREHVWEALAEEYRRLLQSKGG